MTAPLAHSMVAATSTVDWLQDRMTEARGVLADTSQHPDSLVILAARVIAGQTDDTLECADAVDLLCQLDCRPLHAMAAAAFPIGGAT